MIVITISNVMAPQLEETIGIATLIIMINLVKGEYHTLSSNFNLGNNFQCEGLVQPKEIVTECVNRENVKKECPRGDCKKKR